MKSILFKTISIKNFLSVGNTPVIIDFKTGLNIITGSNKDKDDSRNGVGKSTIADAIFFAIFGSPLRDIKKDLISNDSYNGSCEVQLTLDIVTASEITKVQVVRQLDPSKVFLYIDGIDKTLDSIANTTKAISQLLNCNAGVFENCVIMTLNNATPFMCRDKQDKRKFIESIFNLEVFGKMLSNVKLDYTNNKNVLETEIAKKNQAENTIKNLEQQERNAQNEKAIKMTKALAKIEEAKGRLAGLKDTQLKTDINTLIAEKNNLTTKLLGVESARQQLKTALEQSLIEYKQIEDKVVEYRVKKTEYNSTLNSTTASFEKMSSSAGSCPVCLRSITELDVQHINEERIRLQSIIFDTRKAIEALDRLKKELDNELTDKNGVSIDIKNRLSKLDAIELDLKTKISRIQTAESDLDKLQQKIDLVEMEIKGLEEAAKQVDSNTISFSSAIVEQQTLLGGLSVNVDNLKNRISLLDKVRFVFSEEGVKSFLLKQILDLFNNRLEYYLSKLDANCICTFNEYFEETIINDKNKMYSYYNFSGAERKKLDLACLFTFMDIRRLQGDVSFNISLYDELLDSSLDAKGVELVVDILKERVEKYDECIYIISHRKESTKLATGEVIYLQKNNGITTRVDFK